MHPALSSPPSRLRAAKLRDGAGRRSSSFDSPRQAKAALLAGLSVVASLACDVTIKDGDIQNVSMHATVTEEWSRHYAIAAGGRVEIVNGNGPIQAVVGPAGSVDIAAVLEARAMTEDRAKEILSEVTLEESAAPDHVRVAPVRRRGRGDLDITFKVTLPADARLEMTGNNGTLEGAGLRGHVKAMVVNGAVDLTAMSGTIDAASVNGPISVKMAQVTGPMRLESTNGRIALEIPKTAKATLKARAVNGGIRITDLAVEQGTGRRIRTLESPLNGGGPEIDLRVTNGRITIEGK